MATETAELERPGVEPAVASTYKWIAYQGTTSLPNTGTMLVGSDGIAPGGQAPGAFAAGDLYLVAVTFGGSQSNVAISGTGWTQLINAINGGYQLLVWAKNVSAGETGVYTVSWMGSTTPTWTTWNLGQSVIDAWNGVWANSDINGAAVSPACTPSAAANVVFAYWLGVGDTSITLPGSLTSLANVQQTQVPCRMATGYRLITGGTPQSFVAQTLPVSQQPYGAFHLAIRPVIAPVTGFKWVAYQNSAALPVGPSVVAGQTNVGQALGAFATGDLYIVAVNVWGGSIDPGPISISGSGWTNIVQVGPSSDNVRLAVFAKSAGAGETGIYTLSWANNSYAAWMSWNYGQATLDAWMGQTVNAGGTANLIAPSCSPAGAADTLLAYWLADGTTITLPGSLTSRVNVLTGSSPWIVGSGDKLLSASGPTGNLTAVGSGPNLDYSAFQLAIRPGFAPSTIFPAFTPLVPPPPIGLGGGPPPTFPPPTPPPIGAIPLGVLIGPAIAPAGVPPSVAGVTQPQYGSGSATVPAVNGYFTQFTTTFPSPTVVFSNIITVPTGSYSSGWTSTLPAYTASTICVHAQGIA
jgi:hypothetical protein